MSLATETLRSQSKSLEALSFKEASKEASKEAFIEAVKEKLEAQKYKGCGFQTTGGMNNERFGVST